MIETLDYIQDFDDNFWIISYISDKPYGFIVYKVDDLGDRFNYITNKKYLKQKEIISIPIPSEYKQLFKPIKFYNEHKNDLKGVWKDFVLSLNAIGIKDDFIGIFGSYLIGFDIIKDVDFVIYGVDNLKLYYKNNEYIKSCIKANYISKEHIEYQYNKFKDTYNKENDLKEIISRNWSGVQIEKGVLSTPRFVDFENQIIPNVKGINKLIEVKVLNGLTSVCIPRIVEVLYNDIIYKLITPIWKFQSFAHTEDILEVYGIIDDKNKIILLNNQKEHFIKYKYKSDKVN